MRPFHRWFIYEFGIFGSDHWWSSYCFCSCWIIFSWLNYLLGFIGTGTWASTFNNLSAMIGNKLLTGWSFIAKISKLHFVMTLSLIFPFIKSYPICCKMKDHNIQWTNVEKQCWMLKPYCHQIIGYIASSGDHFQNRFSDATIQMNWRIGSLSLQIIKYGKWIWFERKSNEMHLLVARLNIVFFAAAH